MIKTKENNMVDIISSSNSNTFETSSTITYNKLLQHSGVEVHVKTGKVPSPDDWELTGLLSSIELSTPDVDKIEYTTINHNIDVGLSEAHQKAIVVGTNMIKQYVEGLVSAVDNWTDGTDWRESHKQLDLRQLGDYSNSYFVEFINYNNLVKVMEKYDVPNKILLPEDNQFVELVDREQVVFGRMLRGLKRVASVDLPIHLSDSYPKEHSYVNYGVYRIGYIEDSGLFASARIIKQCSIDAAGNEIKIGDKVWFNNTIGMYKIQTLMTGVVKKLHPRYVEVSGIRENHTVFLHPSQVIKHKETRCLKNT